MIVNKEYYDNILIESIQVLSKLIKFEKFFPFSLRLILCKLEKPTQL